MEREQAAISQRWSVRLQKPDPANHKSSPKNTVITSTRMYGRLIVSADVAYGNGGCMREIKSMFELSLSRSSQVFPLCCTPLQSGVQKAEIDWALVAHHLPLCLHSSARKREREGEKKRERQGVSHCNLKNISYWHSQVSDSLTQTSLTWIHSFRTRPGEVTFFSPSPFSVTTIYFAIRVFLGRGNLPYCVCCWVIKLHISSLTWLR